MKDLLTGIPFDITTTLAAAQWANCLLSKVGMEHDLEKMSCRISGGMQERVGLARARALDPDIVLFDEPTAGLDPITASEIESVDYAPNRFQTA